LGKQLLSFASVGFCLLISGAAIAERTYGPEFTFTNNQMIDAQPGSHVTNNPMTVYFKKRLAQAILERCPDCVKKTGADRYGNKVYRIIYTDGFYFEVTTDPGVVEVKMKPLTVTEIASARYKGRIQNDLFDIAASLGMIPGRVGGGHIHMGLQTSVGSDLLLMRNLLVDFANHPELALGILHNDMRNAPPISRLPIEQQNAFKKIIAEVDSGEIQTLVELAARVTEFVYGGPDFQKKQALNLDRVTQPLWLKFERTIEFRAIRALASAEEFVMIVRLLDARMEYLSSFRHPLPLDIPTFGTGPGSARKKMQHFMSNGREYRIRTCDIHLVRVALYQLS
jgi:hypothetical protein